MNMENMYRMRAAHKEIKETGETLHPVTGEEMELGEHDRTLDQIFQDKKEQDRFLNRFLYDKDADKAKDVVETLASGTMLSQEQNAFLEKSRLEYNVRRAEIEKVCEMLTPEELLHIAGTDPRIQEVIGKIGPEKTAALLTKEFEDLAISDAKSLKKMIKNLRDVTEIRTSVDAAELERHVQSSLLSRNISEEKYWQATSSGLTGETRENLRKLVAEDFGWFRKSLDFVANHKLSQKGSQHLYKNFEHQQEFLKECDKHLKVVGKVLRGTLTPDVSMAMQKYMLEGGELKDKKPEDNVTTIADYRRMKEEASPAPIDIKARYEAYKAAEIKRLKITDTSKQSAAIQGINDTFANNELANRKKYRARGVIGALIAMLFGSGPQTKDDIKNVIA